MISPLVDQFPPVCELEGVDLVPDKKHRDVFFRAGEPHCGHDPHRLCRSEVQDRSFDRDVAAGVLENVIDPGASGVHLVALFEAYQALCFQVPHHDFGGGDLIDVQIHVRSCIGGFERIARREAIGFI